VTATTFGTTALSLRGGAKGACRHVSTPTLKSVMELRKSAESVVKSESYIEGEASSPLYWRALGITVSGLWGV